MLAKPILGVWDFNVTKNIVRSNSAKAEIFGLDPAKAAEGLPQSAFVAAIHPDDADRIQTRVAETVKNLTSYSETLQVRDAKGVYRLLFAQGAAYESPEGIMFPGTFIAITPEQLSRLRHSTNALDEIADHCLAARRLADQREMRVLKSLLDLTLEEVGQKLALALRARLADW